MSQPLSKKRMGTPTMSLGSISKLSLADEPPLPPLPNNEIPDLLKDSKYKLEKSQFQQLKRIGAGSGGVVSKVLHLPTNLVMAQKIIKMCLGNVDQEDEKKQKKQLLRELKILKKCNSPHVIGFYGAFIDDNDIFVMMEFMDVGSLDSMYTKYGAFPENITICIACHVFKGLIYLFDTLQIVHRDIKPANILVSSAGFVKLADFGVSKELTGTMAVTFTGTQGYLAPERINTLGNYSTESDVWSVGLTLIEISTGIFPFPPEATVSIIDLIQYIEQAPSPKLPSAFSPQFQELVDACLVKDPKQRLAPKALLELAACTNERNNPTDLVAWIRTLEQNQ